MENEVAQLLKETISLAEAGLWDEIYEEAKKREIAASELTKYLWESHVYPETEGLTKIPEDFAAGLKV